MKTPSFQIDCVMVELRHTNGTVGEWSKIEVPCSKKNSLDGWWAVGLLLKTPSFQIDCVMVELRHTNGTVGEWSKIEVPFSEKN